MMLNLPIGPTLFKAEPGKFNSVVHAANDEGRLQQTEAPVGVGLCMQWGSAETSPLPCRILVSVGLGQTCQTPVVPSMNWFLLFHCFGSGSSSRAMQHSDDLLAFEPFPPCPPCLHYLRTRRTTVIAPVLPRTDSRRGRFAETVLLSGRAFREF